MKSLALILTGLLAWAPLASADNLGTLFGAMATGQATGKGQTTLSGTFGFADVTTYGGSVGYGFTEKMDGRIRFGALDESGFDTGLVLGGDLRWQLWNTTKMTGSRPKPFDLSVGGFLEWSRWHAQEEPFAPEVSMSVFEIGFQAIGSRSYPLDSGGTLTPYARLNIRHENLSVTIEDSQFGSSSADDSQVALGANMGVAWGVSREVILLGELQLDGNDGLFLGVDYRP